MNPKTMPPIDEDQQVPYLSPVVDVTGLTRWAFDLTQNLADLQHMLNGDMKNFDTGEWIPTSPLLNQAGVHMCMSLLTAACSRLTPLTQYNDAEIKHILKYTYRSLKNHLFFEYHKYDLKPENIEIVLDICITFLRNIFYAAKAGALLKMATTIRQEKEITSFVREKGGSNLE